MMYPNTSILDPDNGPTGFATDDFQFAAIPFGKKYMILAKGQQLEVVKTRQLAEIRLEQLKKAHPKLQTGSKTPVQPKSRNKAKTPSGPLVSEEANLVTTKDPPKKPKSKSVTVKKPATLHPNPLLDALS